MKIDILTLFPEMFVPLKESIIGRASDAGKLEINIINIRDYSPDRKHFKCDDYAFGGGCGMLMMPEPIYNAIEAIDPNHSFYRIYMTPTGNLFNDCRAREMALKDKDIILLCGHYEGVDQRVIDLCIDEEISVGDYILTGGELPAMIVVDAVSRYIDGVLGNSESAYSDSFSNGLLEYPQYTRPRVFKGLEVPEVLLSGHHENIDKWRNEQSEYLTRKRRPELIKEKDHGDD